MTELFIKQEEKYSRDIKKEIDNSNKLIETAENIINHLLYTDSIKVHQSPKINTPSDYNIESPKINTPSDYNKHNKILDSLKKINKYNKIFKNNLLIIKNINDKTIINNKIIEIKKCINIIFNNIHELKKNINNM